MPCSTRALESVLALVQEIDVDSLHSRQVLLLKLEHLQQGVVDNLCLETVNDVAHQKRVLRLETLGLGHQQIESGSDLRDVLDMRGILEVVLLLRRGPVFVQMVDAVADDIKYGFLLVDLDEDRLVEDLGG